MSNWAVNTYAQAPHTVGGQVTDKQTEEPLVGVSVVLKGTYYGTHTGIGGFYSLQISSADANNGTLVFSYVGYKTQEVKINGRIYIDVEMELEVGDDIMPAAWMYPLLPEFQPSGM